MGSSKGQQRRASDPVDSKAQKPVDAERQANTDWERWSPPRKRWMLYLAGLLFVAWLGALLLLIDLG
ncbi:MAG: hypothetical protein GY768_01275 [Planctomycetaceae bacterium]|nr:hypothetical protein [Planctomycetaceae bacterium]